MLSDLALSILEHFYSKTLIVRSSFHHPMAKSNRFTDISPKLSEESLRAIESFGFTHMTPVQATSIPLFLQHKDVCVEATTGSGKTLSFGIPIFEMCKGIDPPLAQYDIGALVIAPTRELAIQIHEVFQKLAVHHITLKCSLFVGGTSVQDNTTEYLRDGGQIIVGTPGRILDIFNRNSQINLKRLEVLVMDEADTLLDMGFKDSINQILSMLPKQRRTGLFSATQTKEVKELARAGLRNPVSVSVRVQNKPGIAGSAVTDAEGKAITQLATPSSLDNWFLMREYDQRPKELIDFINTHVNDKIIVFCATCACVDYYSNAFHQMSKFTPLLAKSVQVVGFHGKMVAKKRSILYKKFKSLSAGVMFSTDVAARGIDIPDVDWIVQLAAPKDPAFFVHRVGRTARAGKKGGALLFITKEEESYIALLRGRGVPLKNGDDADIFRQEVINEVVAHAAVQSAAVPGELSKPKSGKQSAPSSSSSSASCSSPVDALTALKDLAKSDRDLLESGSTAFMSYVKAYTENLCSYIFRLENLDIGSLGRAYGLLRLPKMAETRGVKGKPIVFDTDPIDTSTIPYRHHEKEQARLKRLKESKDKAEQEEQEKKNKKQQWVPAEQFERVDKKRERKAKKSMRAKFQEEWDDLAAEEMLFRKFKKGKLSKDDYDGMLTSDKVDEEVLKEHRPKRGQNKKVSDDDSDDIDSDLSEDSD